MAVGAVEDATLQIILRAKDEASQTIGGVEGTLGGIGKALIGMGVVSAAALVGIGVMSIKAAGDFQQATTRIVTEAGESANQIGMIREALIRLGPEVGKSPKELADGMYFIESAGFHGKAGLAVLEASAKAARVGLSEFTPVADAVTSALNAYQLPAAGAAHITDLLLQTVSEGKLQMEDLAGNIGKVLPYAAAAHVSFGELGAAIATMTMQGTNAAQATTGLRFLISNLLGPTSQAKKAMAEVGLSAIDLSNTLTHKGLQAALQDITDHVGKKFPAGSAQYTAALKEIVGGTRGMTTALELTGPHMAQFHKNLLDMASASEHGGKVQQGWQEIQGNFNFSMDRMRAGLSAAAIVIGNQLLPYATQFMNWLSSVIPTLATFGLAVFTHLIGAIQAFIAIITFLVSVLVGVGNAINEHRTRYELVAAFILTVLTPAIVGLAATIMTRLVMAVIEGTTAFIANTVQMVIQSANYLRLYTQIGLHTAAVIASTVANAAQTAAMWLWNAATTAYNIVQNEGIIGLGRFIVVSTAAKIATIASTVAQWALNVALSANPIGIIIIAIAAFVAIMVLLYNKFPPVHAAVNFLFGLIGNLAGAIGGFVKGPLSAFIGALGTLFGIIGKVVGALSGLSNIHLPSISLPHFQHGTVAGPGFGGAQMGIFGEGSEPEAVVPFSKLQRMIGGGGGSTVNIAPAPVILDGREIARVVFKVGESERRLRGGLYGGAA